MTIATRVWRNVARGRARTLGVAVAVGIALSAFLILSQINTGIGASVASAEAALQDVITVQSAGASTFSFNTHMNGSAASKVATAPYVTSVQRILIEAPGANFSGGMPSGGSPPSGSANFTLYQGIDTDTSAGIGLFGGFGGESSFTITAGRDLDAADENSQVALVGSSYASDHSLVPGSPISVNGTTFQVVGLYSTGSMFGGGAIIMPYPAAQAAFAASGPNLLYVLVGAASDLSAAVQDLRTILGSSYDVTAPSEDAGGGFASALGSVLSSTQFEADAALAVGAAIMVVVMALVSAQRTREIGVMKAIGFGNSRVLAQLLSEGILLSAFGLPIGLLATVWIGPSVAQIVASSATPSGGPGGFRGGGFFTARLLGRVSFAITPEVLVLGIAVAVGFGILGSLYPIMKALRSRPAEALRHE